MNYLIPLNGATLTPIIGVYEIKRSMGCSDKYKNAYVHEFQADVRDVELMEFIIKSLKGEVLSFKLKSGKKSIIFKMAHIRLQGLVFKLCRYVRSVDTKAILLLIKSLIENNIKPYNAIPLAHMATTKTMFKGSYTRSMDAILVLYDNRNTVRGYRSWNEFMTEIKKINVGYIHMIYTAKQKSFFQHKSTMQDVANAMESGNYALAQRLIYPKKYK